MELFKSTNIDFLGKKWYFLGFSLIFSIAGVLSIAFWHHIPLGVDFKGGTLVDVKFAGAPDYNKVRRAVDDSGYHDAEIQRLGAAAQNELIIRLPQRETRWQHRLRRERRGLAEHECLVLLRLRARGQQQRDQVAAVVVAVPMLVVIKAVCDHVEDFTAIGELLGE